MTEKIRQHVLILDDGVPTPPAILSTLAGRGLAWTIAHTPAAAQEKLAARPWDLLLVEVSGPSDTPSFVWQIRQEWPECPVIALGSGDSAGAAVRAMKAGCADFLSRPVDPGALAGLLERLVPNHQVPLAAPEADDARGSLQIAGQSPALLEVIGLARKIAPTSMPVLVLGESGAGKELISHLIHRASSRSDGPYIRVNCAAVSESLLESELFGHERGAFTGAYVRRRGRFERAHGGTLLLDEISETGSRLQAELLRVLEQQDFERVGGEQCIRVNVRVISTSNRDLMADVERGRFRRDLYYRIRGVQLVVPPLRQRKGDIPVLAWHFVNRYAREVRRQITRIDPELLAAFERHPWPGNVRELRNLVRAALALGEGPALSLEGTGLSLSAEPPQRPRAGGAEPLAGSTLMLQELERRAILEALRRTNSHHARAAGLLGITDRTLREKLRRYRQADAVGSRQGPEGIETDLVAQVSNLCPRTCTAQVGNLCHTTGTDGPAQPVALEGELPWASTPA